MKSLFRKLVLLVVVSGVVGLIGYSFLPKPVEVDLAQVTRGLLRVTVDQEGKTRIKERYVVSSPLSGRLLRINHDPGDRVEVGNTVVAAIDPTAPSLLDARARAEAEARVKAARAANLRTHADRDRAVETHNLSKRNLHRAQKLYGSKSIGLEEYQAVENRERIAHEELKSAQFAVKIAEFEHEQAEAALRWSKPSSGEQDTWRFLIQSPIEGKVLKVFQESATVVTPGTRLLELGDPTDLECEIDVLSTDAVKIAPGAKVVLEHWGGPYPLEGRVRLVEPAAFTKISALGVEEQRVWVIVDFTDPLEKRRSLGDAYRVEARIVIWEKPDVLQVPAGALFRRGERWCVFRVADGTAQLHPVKIGQSNGIATQILEGLDENDLVVVHPSDKIEDGVAVVAR